MPVLAHQAIAPHVLGPRGQQRRGQRSRERPARRSSRSRVALLRRSRSGSRLSAPSLTPKSPSAPSRAKTSATCRRFDRCRRPSGSPRSRRQTASSDPSTSAQPRRFPSARASDSARGARLERPALTAQVGLEIVRGLAIEDDPRDPVEAAGEALNSCSRTLSTERPPLDQLAADRGAEVGAAPGAGRAVANRAPAAAAKARRRAAVRGSRRERDFAAGRLDRARRRDRVVSVSTSPNSTNATRSRSSRPATSAGPTGSLNSLSMSSWERRSSTSARPPRGPRAGCSRAPPEAPETTSSASPMPIRIPIARATKTAASEAAW